MSSLLSMIMEAKRQIEALGPLPPTFKIVESTAAMRYVRVRTYPRRRAKSLRHWRRMDKKWCKRYGERGIPAVFQLPADSRGHILIVAHPILYPQYAKALRAGLASMGML